MLFSESLANDALAFWAMNGSSPHLQTECSNHTQAVDSHQSQGQLVIPRSHSGESQTSLLSSCLISKYNIQSLREIRTENIY